MKTKKIIITLTLIALMPVFLYFISEWTLESLIHIKKEIMVPDIVGKSLAESVDLISSLGLGIRKEGAELNENIPEGTVIRQNPKSGMTVREGKIVRITLSQGGKVIYVPDLVGQQVRSAEILIRSSGLNLGEQESRYSVVMEKDFVISQDPSSNATVEKDTLINLVISAGLPPENIKLMKDWSNKNISEARFWFENNNIDIVVTEEEAINSSEGTILRQDPAPDSDLSSVTNVMFWISGSNVEPAPGKNIFYYEIPQGGGERQLRFSLIDENGEKDVFNGSRPPGTKLAIPISSAGSARMRVFINNILVEEREIE